MKRPYRHKMVVTVYSDTDRGRNQMRDRLTRWISAYGHTAAGFGFEFIGVVPIANPYFEKTEEQDS